ncbi:MAG: hypothetical protein GF353_19075 [Candidatus Lokiarchaeota archaeon]|nr:hypothetical protein [Candidatus Lokiarchaeota archaeon]
MVDQKKIQFECSKCHTKYNALAKQAGKVGSCKKCGTKIVVPNLEPDYSDQDLDDHYKIESYATKIGGQVFAIVYENTKSWVDEFKMLMKRKIAQSAIDMMVLESVYLGHFISLQKIEPILSKEENNLFEINFKEVMIVALSAYFNSPYKEKDLIKHNELIKELYHEFLDDRISAFNNTNITTVNMFKNLLVHNAFNNNNYVDIKFMEMKFKNKLRIKLAYFFNNLADDSDSNIDKSAYFDIRLLDSFILNVWNSIMSIDIKKISSEISN